MKYKYNHNPDGSPKVSEIPLVKTPRLKIEFPSVDKVKQGKKNRVSGARFEAKVRDDLENKGWIVSRWGNNVEIFDDEMDSSKNRMLQDVEPKLGKLVPAKSTRFRSNTHGFPDFVCFMKLMDNSPYIDQISGKEAIRPTYEIFGVEVKSNGYLNKIEKEKCKWLLDNNIFSKILIAKKGKKRGQIEYDEFN